MAKATQPALAAPPYDDPAVKAALERLFPGDVRKILQDTSKHYNYINRLTQHTIVPKQRVIDEIANPSPTPAPALEVEDEEHGS